MMDYTEFKKEILKLKDNRVHKLTNSHTTYEIYKLIRKHKWYNIGRPLLEKEFYDIIRLVNHYIGEELLKGNSVTLPERMGLLELRKHSTKVRIVNGKLKVSMPIDWDRTIKLWYEDEESFDNRTLIRIPEKEVFKVFYNKRKALYNNKAFMEFNLNRELKKKLKGIIRNKQIDAFEI